MNDKFDNHSGPCSTDIINMTCPLKKHTSVKCIHTKNQTNYDCRHKCDEKWFAIDDNPRRGCTSKINHRIIEF